MRQMNVLLASTQGGAVSNPNFTNVSKNYELTNHLGNVLAVVSDTKTNDGRANVVSASDYFPFGMQVPGRVNESEEYRYGFGGHEKEDNIKGAGNYYTTQARPYDPRLGRWWSVDPQFKAQPGWSSYKSFLDNPILFQDPDGEIEFITIRTVDAQNNTIEQCPFNMRKGYLPEYLKSACPHQSRRFFLVFSLCIQNRENLP